MAKVALVIASTLCTVLLGVPEARAAEPRTHDAFHARGALGFGYAGDAFESDEVLGEPIDGKLGGVAFAGELSLGYGVVPGAFLGAGVYFNHVPQPRAEDVDWLLGESDIKFDHGGFTLIGPMFDFYPAPEGGFHLALALGYGLFGIGDGEFDGGGRANDEMRGAGLGGMLGVGYDLWVADVLSVGVLGRFMVASTNAEDSNDLDWHHTVYSPALLLSVSFD